MTKKEKAIEKFTDILNIFHEKRDIIEDFKYRFSTWCNTFVSEKKLFESLKSQVIAHLKLSRISRVLITAIVFICILETYTKFQKAFAYLGLTLYLTVIAMNIVSNIIIARRNSQNDYISEVSQYFENVYAMFELFKLRLDVLRRRCNWRVKLDPFLSGVEPEYSNQGTSYARLWSSAFHLYHVYGIAVGFITFLLCCYFEYEIFAILEVFAICLLFSIAIAKDIKIHRLQEKLQENTKSMRSATSDFLTWFENDSEMYKILQEHQVSTIVMNLFLVKTLRYCLKPRYLNFAISITACEVFASLNVSRNDLKNALMFLADGKYFVLDKLTVKTINTQTVKQPSKEKIAKSELPENLEINRCRVVDDNTKPITSENKLNSRFVNEDSEMCSKHTNRKLTSTHPQYVKKASKIPILKNVICEVVKHKSKGSSFDENLPLRYELRKFEPKEEAVSSNDEFFPDSAKELCQNKVDDGNGRENPYIYVKEISKKSISTGTSDAKDIEGKSFLLCKQCIDIVSSNSTLHTSSENEFCQTKEEPSESVKKHLTKESETHCNTDELFISEYKDTNLKTKRNKTNESAVNSFNKSVVISHDEHSCESTKRISSAEAVNINELVASDFNEMNDSNLHEKSINKMNFKDESETINKDINLNLNGNKPIKVNVKGFMTDDACLSGNHTLIETKNHIDENEMLRCQFHESNRSDKQEKSTGNNSIAKTNKTFVSDQSHQLQSVCTNLVEMSEKHFSSDTTPSEKLFSENSESNLNKQNKNSFADECNENQIACAEINYERLINNSVYDTEIYPSGTNSFKKELNEIGDSGSFEPEGNETKSENKCRIIEEDKIETKHSYAPPGVTNNIRFTGNTIEETQTHCHQNETHENIFNENRKSYLHKQKLSETEVMDMDAYDSRTKKFLIDNISNNPNANANKAILNCDAHISENESMVSKIASEIHLDENEILKDTSHCTSYFYTQSTIEAGYNEESPINENTTIDNSGCYTVDSRYIHVDQNIKDRPAISNNNKSSDEEVIDSLAKETEACLKVHETSDDIIDEHNSTDFNQKSANEAELISEFEITPKTIMERGVNLTGQMDTALNFKDIFENQNEQEKQNVEKNMDEKINGIINEDLSEEFLSKVNVKDICQRELYHETMSSISGRDLTLLKPREIACNGRLVKLSDVNKENFIPENAEVDQNSKSDKGMKKNYQKNTSKNKNNRKISPKTRGFKPRNKKTNKRFSKKIPDSAGAIDHLGSPMEGIPNESTDLERKELIPNNSKNFSLLDEPNNTAIGVADKILEQIKNVNDTKAFEVVQNLSLQQNLDELVPGLDNHDKINTGSEIYQNFLILNQVDKLIDSMTNADCFFQAQNMDPEANHPEIIFPHTKSQEIDSPVSDKEFAWTVIKHEHLKQAIDSEHKSISMVRPYCETNNKIEIASPDNIKTTFATPSLATEPLKHDNKCITSTNETVHNKNEFTNVPKSEDAILYFINAVVPSESEVVASTENIATDNSQSKSCLTSTSPRIIKKGKRRIRGKLKIEELTNCVSLESSAGSTAFNAPASTEEENRNISILGTGPSNRVNFESSEGIVFNASTCTEEENRNGLIVDKEETDCVSLESAAGNVVNAKISTEEESGYKLIVDREQTNRISLESLSNSVLNAKTSTEEENQKMPIMDKDCGNLESSAGSVFNSNACAEEENGNGLILDKGQTDCVISESSAGSVFNKKSSTEEENGNREIVDKEYIICSKEQTSYVSLESSAENVSNPKINTKEEKSITTHIVNKQSLNERKIQLAEQLPLESGDTESEISFSEKSSCQKLIEDNHGIRSDRNINDKVQSISNVSTLNLAGIPNSQGSHSTRYAGNFNDEVQNKVDKSAASTIRTSNSITYKENEMTSKYTTNPNNEHTQLYLKKESFATVTSNMENDIKISKDSKICHIRNILTHLWKNEQGKMFEIFPKYRNSVKRKIIHFEKELRRNDKECVRKLSVVDVKENRLAFKTSDGEEHFSSELEVTCKYSDDECEKNQEERMRNWLESMSTENLCEISKQGLNESKTPPTGSSEDFNFHFHQSTSPSDTSSDATGETSDTSDDIHRTDDNGHLSSAFFSTKPESFQWLEVDKDKNISQEKRINRVDDSTEISVNDGCIKWISMITDRKPDKISNNQPMNSSSISKELKQTARKQKCKKIIREMRIKKSEVDKESEFMLKNSRSLSYSANTCSTNKHLDSMPSDVHLNSGDFEALTPNPDVEQTNSQKINQTDPLKYHLMYKNLELHVFDSSPSLTIRLIDENEDSDAALTPRWQSFVNNSLSSSNSSLNELQLPSRISSSSTGETVKENININKGDLKMLVGRSDYEKASVSSDSYKSHINKISMENISEITDTEDCDSLMNSENAEVNQIKQHIKEDLSIATEFHESEFFFDKHTINESVVDDNDIPGGYDETVIKETGLVRTSTFKHTDERNNGNLMDGKSADKVSQEKKKGDRSEKKEFHESENFANKYIINESVVDNNDVLGENIETVVKEIGVIEDCSYGNISIKDNGNFIDNENSKNVSQHNDKEDRSTMIEFDESNEHFVNKHTISESVKIDNNAVDINTEAVVKETKMLTSYSLDKDWDETSDIRDNNSLIDNESADKVSQQKNKEDRLAAHEFHESQSFINNHTYTIHKSSKDNNDVPDKNIETVVKETKIVASCSSGNISSEQLSVGNEISKTNANNVSDKNINVPVVNDCHVPGGNTKNIEKETETTPICSYSVGNEISETDANNVSDKNINVPVVNGSHVPGGNTENIVKETETTPSCSYSVGNKISETDANNANDKNMNVPVVNDSDVPSGNTETIIKETDTAPSCSYSVGNEISETDENSVSDTNINPAGINENLSLDAETEVTTENELSKDFQFETNGIKLTCKPRSESDSVEVKFRKLEDKTKLTFKSGSKKLYLKMSSKT